MTRPLLRPSIVAPGIALAGPFVGSGFARESKSQVDRTGRVVSTVDHFLTR